MKKEDLKNKLRDKTCDNCVFITSNLSGWCMISSYQPSKNTCKYWRAVKEPKDKAK